MALAELVGRSCLPTATSAEHAEKSSEYAGKNDEHPKADQHGPERKTRASLVRFNATRSFDKLTDSDMGERLTEHRIGDRLGPVEPILVNVVRCEVEGQRPEECHRSFTDPVTNVFRIKGSVAFGLSGRILFGQNRDVQRDAAGLGLCDRVVDHRAIDGFGSVFDVDPVGLQRRYDGGFVGSSGDVGRQANAGARNGQNEGEAR